MENVLIPTDFTLASLRPIALLAEALPDREFAVTLFHPFRMPSDIRSLLFLQKSIPVSQIFGDELRAECRRLKQQYGQTIASINFKPLYGTTKATMSLFIEGNEIDILLYDDRYTYIIPHQYSEKIADCIKLVTVQILAASQLRKKKVPAPSVLLFKELTV
ncbi:hypothetical protein [Taibaiella soli]|uniref:UspA domain-containing protein n=1 Tax=Taibaiella soli TaxID=1649169 RepID=A0A2W2AIB6_9BACT|nr:hypothetical protein [Taibaiella soli]PZF73322.1 hypothetical protein DN068_09135 [Taibaiella soli]